MDAMWFFLRVFAATAGLVLGGGAGVAAIAGIARLALGRERFDELLWML